MKHSIFQFSSILKENSSLQHLLLINCRLQLKQVLPLIDSILELKYPNLLTLDLSYNKFDLQNLLKVKSTNFDYIDCLYKIETDLSGLEYTWNTELYVQKYLKILKNTDYTDPCSKGLIIYRRR